MTFISYAQNFEDVMLMRALADVREGVYVDVGAQHPVVDSVTKAFYERGWHGINIDPMPQWFELLKQHRPRDINLQLAVSEREGEVTLFGIDETGLSTMDADVAQMHRSQGQRVVETQVRSRPLTDIVLEAGLQTVHFLKIDVEGAEHLVLDGLDLERVRPWIVVVEATEPNSPKPRFEAWQPTLLRHRYDLVYNDGLNRYYLAQEHAELRHAFDRPPNVFDRFVRYHEWGAQNHANMLSGQLDAAREAMDHAVIVARAERAEAERDAGARELAQARQDLAQVRQDQAQQRREHQTAQAGFAQSLQHLSDSLRNHDHSLARIETLARERDEALRSLQEVLTSRSWRLTGGLRKFAHSLRHWRPTVRAAIRPAWRLVYGNKLTQGAAIRVAHALGVPVPQPGVPGHSDPKAAASDGVPGFGATAQRLHADLIKAAGAARLNRDSA